MTCLVVSYFGMIEGAKNNSSTEVYFDLYCVSIASQVLSAISDWGWYLLIVIPLYGGYLAYALWQSNPLSSLLGGGASSSSGSTAVDSDLPVEKKKVKYVRGR